MAWSTAFIPWRAPFLQSPTENSQPIAIEVATRSSAFFQDGLRGSVRRCSWCRCASEAARAVVPVVSAAAGAGSDDMSAVAGRSTGGTRPSK